MDYHDLQRKLFAMDPVDPAEDKRRMVAAAQGGASDVPPTKDYVKESVSVPQGSMPVGIDSIADFAALAGVVTEGKQKPADQVRGSESMPKAEPGRKKHPYQDRLVGESSADALVGTLMAKVQELDARIARLEADNTRLRNQQPLESDIKERLYAALAQKGIK